MTDLVIIGTGDHAKVALETARAAAIRVVLLIEPNPQGGVPASAHGVPVVGRLDEVRGRQFIVAIGANEIRASLFAEAVGLGGIPATLVHPLAIILGGGEVGEGSHVCAGAIVGVEARIGRDVIVNTAASVDHDGVIGDHAFVGPGARLAGRVAVGAGAHVGIGSTVIEGRTIGQWSLVAAGAAVIRDVAPHTRVAGVPAQLMEQIAVND